MATKAVAAAAVVAFAACFVVGDSVWREEPERFVLDGRHPVLDAFRQSRRAWHGRVAGADPVSLTTGSSGQQQQAAAAIPAVTSGPAVQVSP